MLCNNPYYRKHNNQQNSYVCLLSLILKNGLFSLVIISSLSLSCESQFTCIKSFCMGIKGEMHPHCITEMRFSREEKSDYPAKFNLPSDSTLLPQIVCHVHFNTVVLHSRAIVVTLVPAVRRYVVERIVKF